MLFKTTRLRLIIIFVALMLALFLKDFAFASEKSESFGVAPALISVKIKKSNFYKYPVNVFNDGKKTINLEVKFFDFVLDPEGKVRFLDSLSSKRSWSAATWLRVSNKEFSIKPHDTKKVWLFIEPPPHAEAGTYRAMARFTNIPPKNKNKGVTSVRSNVSTLVLIKIAGKTTQKPAMKMNIPSIVFQAPKIDIDLTNKGNVHYFAKGKIGFGTKTKTLFESKLDTPSQGILVLPKAKRKISSFWKNAPYLGSYKVKTDILITGKRKLTEEKSFFLIRWQLIVAVSLIIFIGVALFLFSKRFKINISLRRK